MSSAEHAPVYQVSCLPFALLEARHDFASEQFDSFFVSDFGCKVEDVGNPRLPRCIRPIVGQPLRGGQLTLESESNLLFAINRLGIESISADV
jgi:hypothetical protein